MKNDNAAGRLAALLTILIWGTTFISTKVLLESFTPMEILFMRFVLGLVALTVACPRRLRGTTPRQELALAAAGLTGICLYYLLENIALTHTLASNVGVIVSVAPIFTALLTWALPAGKRPRGSFFAGFLLAMAGIALVSFSGAHVALSPLGDVLALLAALVWAVYSLLTKEIAGWGHSTVLTTRRVFEYGIVFMLGALAIFGFSPDLALLARPVNALNIAYLGLGASALCFVTWGFAVKVLGAVRTSTYIYLVPVITMAASALILHEPVTPASLLGCAFTLVGLAVSERG